MLVGEMAAATAKWEDDGGRRGGREEGAKVEVGENERGRIEYGLRG